MHRGKAEGSGGVGAIRRKVSNERLVQGKTYPVALAPSDAVRRVTGGAKRSQEYNRAVYGAPKTSLCGGRPHPDAGKAIVMPSDIGKFGGKEMGARTFLRKDGIAQVSVP